MNPFRYNHENLLLVFDEIGLRLSKPLLHLLGWLVLLCLDQTRAHLFRLAENLPDDDATEAARQQRVRRFLSNHRLSPARLVMPLLQLLLPILLRLPAITLTMDRTDWVTRGVPINILTVSLYIEGRALPLYWLVWNRKGASSFVQQKQVLQPVLDAIRAMDQLLRKPIHVVADREFASPKLAEWLWTTYRVDSAFRLKKSTYLVDFKDQSIKISTLLQQLKPGQKRILRWQRVTRKSDFQLNVILIWTPQYQEPWVIMTTLKSLEKTVQRYGERFSTEPMYKDCKGNIFDLERTRVSKAERIERLLIPIAIALALGTLEGLRKEETEEAPKRHKTQRSVGLAWLGIRAFSRAFRAIELVRLEAFWQQLFSHYHFAWVDKKIPI